MLTIQPTQADRTRFVCALHKKRLTIYRDLLIAKLLPLYRSFNSNLLSLILYRKVSRSGMRTQWIEPYKICIALVPMTEQLINYATDCEHNRSTVLEGVFSNREGPLDPPLRGTGFGEIHSDSPLGLTPRYASKCVAGCCRTWIRRRACTDLSTTRASRRRSSIGRRGAGILWAIGEARARSVYRGS
jgi:hypothetical protein